MARLNWTTICKRLLLFLLGIFVVPGFAEQRWASDGDKTLRLSLGLSTPGCDFSVTGPGPDATYVPNSPTLPFVSVSYKNYGFSLQLPIEPDAKSVQEKGKSSIQDFQFRFFGHRDTHELIYQQFSGYSIQGWSNGSGAAILRPDVRVQNLSYNFISALSPAHFSNAVAYSQQGIQEKGGGSWMLLASGGSFRVQGGDALVPTQTTQPRGRFADIQSLQNYYLLGGVGYGYQQPIFSRVYMVASLYSGLGYGYQQTKINQVEDWHSTYLHRIGLRIGLGYNYGNHVVAAQLIVDDNSTYFSDGKLSQSTFNTRVFYTYRMPDLDLPRIFLAEQ